MDGTCRAGSEVTKILFVEPPKDYWFLMGEYLPPPTGLLVLAAYIEEKIPDFEIEVMDCQAEGKDFRGVEDRIEDVSPSIVAFSGFTCNAYVCARAAEIAKKVNPDITTIAGGQHFSSTAEESLLNFPEIDFIIRGEGEETLVELIQALRAGRNLAYVRGLSFWHNNSVIHTPRRPLIPDLDKLPYPAYHLVEKNMEKYHFAMMAGKKTRYMILEGSRGCSYRCRFCSQWRHWDGVWRTKSAKRIADEMQYLSERFGGEFLWLTDDNFGYGIRGKELRQELEQRTFTDDITWFFQARTDDIVRNPELVAGLREVGNTWVLTGVENDSPEVLGSFRKEMDPSDAHRAVKILEKNDIFSHTMFVIGSRKDTAASIERLRRFSLDLGSDLALYTVLTPFPGTDIYGEAVQNGWVEDTNYAHYDMAHAIMPTETLSKRQVQEELFICYRAYYGSLASNISGFFAGNKIKRRVTRHMAGKDILNSLRNLV